MFLSFMSYYNLTRYLSGITFIEFLRNLENSMKNAFTEKLIHMNLSIPANETFLNSKEYHYENMKKDIDLIGTQKEEIDDFSKSSLNNVFLFSSLIHFFIIFQVIHFSFMLSDSYIENISNVIFLGIPVILLLGVKYESGKLYSLLNKVSCNMIDTKEQEKEISLLEIEKIALLKKEISIFNDVTVNNNFFMFVFYFSSLFFISYINVLYDFESSHFLSILFYFL